jgi:hypothetical protein
MFRREQKCRRPTMSGGIASSGVRSRSGAAGVGGPRPYEFNCRYPPWRRPRTAVCRKSARPHAAASSRRGALAATMPTTMSTVAAFFRTVAAPVARRRSPTRFTNRVTVPLDQKPLEHPMVWRSLRPGWLSMTKVASMLTTDSRNGASRARTKDRSERYLYLTAF